jgi:hypothetical protein
MNTDKFWSIIESARNEASDCPEMAGTLKSVLEELSAEDVLGFQQQLWQRLSESYRWDLWAVAYIINGGCSDDGFEYFRGWLISQGRQYFDAALRDPRSAADRAEPDDANECEDILYVAATVYKKKTGQQPPQGNFQMPKEPAGNPWEEDELPGLYPELYERFR